MTPGRIAAIIACRDLGRYLREALESVERQTRPAAEILVVDDRSADIYTQQALAAVERDGTRVVQGDGRGASAARNLGARLTSSEYIVWLDADDVLAPAYFAEAASRLDADPGPQFVSCAMRAFGEASYVWKPSPPNFTDAVATGGVPHASTMVRRDLWERVGGFDESLASFELLDFWATVFERGFSGIVLDEALLNYRIRRGSGYRRSIQPDVYAARLSHLYRKHQHAVERHAFDLLRRKEAFLEEQRGYRTSLEKRKTELETERTALERAVAAAVETLASRGETRVALSDFQRVTPLSDRWGQDRGTPIDRRYIERFLAAHCADIRGRVLEVREPRYTRRFGTAVTQTDVLDVDPTNRQATIVADLRHADSIASNSYDCVVVTQTLQLVDEIDAAVAECARILKPGGVLLVTAPTLIRVDDEGGLDGDFWRLTEASARKLFAASFPVDAFEVTSYGNVLAAASFLYGLSAEELSAADLDVVDPNFPVVVAVRAVKPSAPRRNSRPTAVRGSAAILVYHRIAELTADSHRLCTTPPAFEAQMAYVRNHCTPIPLDDLLQAAAAGSMPERAVAVTLDDGYLDALTAASPILTRLGVPATFFVNTDRLDVEHERWWDVLEWVFAGAQAPPRHLPAVLAITVAGHPFRFDTETATARAAALEQLNQIAWPLDARSRLRLLTDVVDWAGVQPPARGSHRVMTGAEIMTLAGRPGHAIGAHTTNHLALSSHPIETKRIEIVEHTRTLASLLGRPVHLFSYPYGDFDADAIAVVREAGFRGAVTVQRALMTAGTNRLLLPRCEVAAGSVAEFEAQLMELFEPCTA